MRCYCVNELHDLIGHRTLKQINHSRTTNVGAIRGLHYQRSPHAEVKLVRCLAGRVLDIAIDLRKNSPTLFCWHAEELTPENTKMMVIPEGFAHGFQVLEPNSQLLYLHTECYCKIAEGMVRFDDPRIAIAWPLPPVDISDRDRMYPLLDNSFEGLDS